MPETLLSHLRERAATEMDTDKGRDVNQLETAWILLPSVTAKIQFQGRSPGLWEPMSIAFPCLLHSGFMIDTSHLPLRGQRWTLTSFPIIPFSGAPWVNVYYRCNDKLKPYGLPDKI